MRAATLLGFAGGIAIGALIAWVARPEPPAVRAEPEIAAAAPSRELAELRAAIERLTARLDASTAQPERSAAAQPGVTDTSELERSIAELRALVDDLRASEGTVAVLAERPGRTPGLLEHTVALQLDQADWPSDQAFFAARKTVASELQSRHAGWTVEQLLAEYGKPDEVLGQQNEGVLLGYDIAASRTAEPSLHRWVRFHVVEGFVTQVSLNFDR